MRAPVLIRWPGVIKPGTVKNDIFASLDWLPTLVNIAGGAKGDALKKRIEAGQYPGIVKTTLDGVDQTEYLSGRSEKSARDTFFYYSGNDRRRFATRTGRCTSRWRPSPAGLYLPGALPLHWAQVVNIKRDPFETAIGSTIQDAHGPWAARSAPRLPPTSTTGTCCRSARRSWLKELESYNEYPPLQDPASYNLDQVMEQIKNRPRLPVAATSCELTTMRTKRAPADGTPVGSNHASKRRARSGSTSRNRERGT